MQTYEQLAASRRAWIDEVLIPWCRRAERIELIQAEQDWINVAGRVDPEMSLWTWAWSRFPVLVHPDMDGLDETQVVRLRLKDGREFLGYPDARRSLQGELRLVTTADDSGAEVGPFSIDEVEGVDRG